MSQENIDAVGRFVGAFSARDVDAMVELAAPDCVIVAQRSALGGAFTDIRHRAESAYEWAPDTRMVVERIVPAGDSCVVVLGRQTGTAGVDGPSFNAPLAVVAELEAALLKRAEAQYATHAEALAAAGLSQ